MKVVGVDWGTTHRRAYALDASGECIDTFADSDGAMACKGRFAAALHAALTQLQAGPELVVLSGMVGSALGWHEVPYVDRSVALDALPAHLFMVPDAPTAARCVIVPGYCIRDQWGQPDVMRGEETQLLGALALGHHSGWFVLPGTHSKWVELDHGRILQLRTYMTGELFNLLGQHGTLAAAIGKAEPVWDASAFADGVHAAGKGALSHQLFSCRARVVCGDMPAASSQAYLSGLLIGSELHDVRRTPTGSHSMDTFKLIGSPELAQHYQAAAALLDVRFDVLDAKAAFLAAMARIHSATQHP
ncbi:MAG: 2-dehydro-3-deoxygalactonokinase [Polaromonas sp.]|nr:2-dehydro-3-deoxygalactonokinase [Polaromonas sp.]